MATKNFAVVYAILQTKQIKVVVFAHSLKEYDTSGLFLVEFTDVTICYDVLYQSGF